MVQEGEKMVRVSTNVKLPKECLEWVDRKVEGRVCANRSHSMVVLILGAMKRQEENRGRIRVLQFLSCRRCH